jgi:capsular polysaccharide biosynthesis protein
MRNERELIERLTPFGFEAVALERLSVREQANLFSGAEIVVGAHGAGLANLLFASPGCQVIEIYMSTYINWCFYTICAAAGLGYDCVIAPVDETQDGVYYHQQSWEAPIQAVLDAVETALG